MAENIVYDHRKTCFSEQQLLRLYDSVGWTAYTQDPSKLMRAVRSSPDVITAWHEKTLCGLIRTISDGKTILYIQDILVLPDYQRMGIGTELLKKILAKHESIRQVVLLTDDTENTRKFYLSNGFQPAGEKNLLCLVRITDSK